MRRFLSAYREPAAPKSGFHRALKLFTARVELSIASLLIKLGKGTSRELEDLLDHAYANVLDAETALPN